MNNDDNDKALIFGDSEVEAGKNLLINPTNIGTEISTEEGKVEEEPKERILKIAPLGPDGKPCYDGMTDDEIRACFAPISELRKKMPLDTGEKYDWSVSWPLE